METKNIFTTAEKEFMIEILLEIKNNLKRNTLFACYEVTEIDLSFHHNDNLKLDDILFKLKNQ